MKKIIALLVLLSISSSVLANTSLMVDLSSYGKPPLPIKLDGYMGKFHYGTPVAIQLPNKVENVSLAYRNTKQKTGGEMGELSFIQKPVTNGRGINLLSFSCDSQYNGDYKVCIAYEEARSTNIKTVSLCGKNDSKSLNTAIAYPGQYDVHIGMEVTKEDQACAAQP